MANQRDPKKKLVGYFATEEEKAALKKLAKERGYKSVADLLRAIASVRLNSKAEKCPPSDCPTCVLRPNS